MLLVLGTATWVVAQETRNASFAPESMAEKVTAEKAREWKTDLGYVAHTYPKEHANLFHRLDEGKFKKAIKSLESEIPNMSSHRIALELGRIVAMPRDGHSYISVIHDPRMKFQFLPIRFYVFSDGIFVTQAGSKYEEVVGAKLTGIGGLSVKDAVKRIAPYISSDNKFGMYEYAPYYLASPSVLYALGVTKEHSVVPMEFEKDGKQMRVTAKLDASQDNSIAAVAKSAAQWADVRANASKPKALTFKHRDRDHWFEYVGDRKLLFVQMNTVQNGKEKTIEQFFGEVVDFVSKNDVEKLVLDLRHNGGGNNQLIRPIIRGLIQMEDIDKRGNLFVVIGRRTFSAAQNLVNALEKWTNATFVGEPTGSYVNMYGDARTFNLPKSGLRLRISELFWQNTSARDNRKWKAPNVAADPVFADYQANVDPAMRAVLAYENHVTLDELAMKRYASMDLKGFRDDAIAFKKNPANKYVDIEGKINTYGYQMISIKQFDAAIGLFMINVELFPKSWNVYDSLAEAYMHKGDHANAVKFYNKSLEINPDNTNAVKMLEKMKQGDKKHGSHNP